MKQLVIVEVDGTVVPEVSRFTIREGVPVLWVTSTGRDRERYVARLETGRAGPPELRQPGAVSDRPDLYERYSAFGERAWRRRKPALLRRLYAAGHGVWGAPQHRVYVGDLTPRHQGVKHVYVGRTTKPVEKRWEEHLTGALSNKGVSLASKTVTKHGRGLRPDLYAHMHVLPTLDDSIEQERQVAHALAVRGYDVAGDGLSTRPRGDGHVAGLATLDEMLALHE